MIQELFIIDGADAIRITICIVMLVVASIMDVRKREISDKVWVSALIAGGLVSIVLMPPHLQYDELLVRYLLSISLTAPLAYIAYIKGLFGGADAKALIVISILVPSYEMHYSIHGIPALTVLTNASLLTLANVLHNVLRNLTAILKGKDIFKGFDEPLYKKMLAFMMGYVARPKGYLFALEEVRDGKRMFNLAPKADSEFVEQSDEIWVTQALPFIIYITIGFVLMLLVGDLIAYAINLTLLTK
ncbi:MAG: A24 family peptidase C-terminal domain-containing protein [Candidatus Nitrosocaldus sp.]